MTEEWRDIPGYEGLYKVSNEGKVKRIERLITTKRGYTQTHRGKAKSLDMRNGYFYTWLFKDNKGKKAYVHHLVAFAFHGPRPENHHVHHVDENRTNNCPENLVYMRDKEHNSVSSRNEKNNNSTLTEADVIRARELAQTMSIAAVARQLNLPYHAIYSAIRGKTWSNIT